jgi:asparagine synthase (glutamine-hydrolysing)
MCGIAGVLSFAAPVDERALSAMARALAHRGPDGDGTWRNGRVGFVHTRLAIIDPVAASAQPMSAEDGRCVVTFNGEIYNYRELRGELAARGAAFRTRSDTEVLLHGFRLDGPAFFARLEGMFAAAFWDGEKLTLLRDRFGMKPLFIARTEKALLFASEPKALIAAGVPARLRPQGVLEYLAFNNTQGTGSIFAGIELLEPACWATVDTGGRLTSTRYWSPPASPRRQNLGEAAILAEIAPVFSAAVRRHLVSDVEVGIYLSGGIDSSLIAAVASREGARLRSFSLSFPEVDDASYTQFAGRLAARFGFEHEYCALSAADVPDLVVEMSALADEPLADGADVAVHALSRQARHRVKTVLTGDGGDEIFAGYHRHRAELFARRYGRILAPLGAVAPLLGPVNRRRLAILRETSGAARYASFLMSFARPRADSLMLLHPDLAAIADFDPLVAFVGDRMRGAGLLTPALCADISTILVDSYLRKSDRAAMMAGIETRLPFLDRPLVECAFSLPESALVSWRTGKIVLRRLLDSLVPDAMSSAPKMGFTVPVAAWLREPRMREIRHWLAGADSPLAGIISPAGLLRLRAEPAGGIDVATQWKLVRLGLWADRWLRTGSAARAAAA